VVLGWIQETLWYGVIAKKALWFWVIHKTLGVAVGCGLYFVCDLSMEISVAVSCWLQ
jgi:hypothetical protein